LNYLGFKIQDIAKAASVSPSTVSRWDNKSPIGNPGSYQFFKIDEVIKKGVDLFGNTTHLKQWLDSPNMALGNEIPTKILTSMIGLELVDEALDALHFGNVM
jgi:putative toxin-antitoxin system antitoxin component (TIGR02293 family)